MIKHSKLKKKFPKQVKAVAKMLNNKVPRHQINRELAGTKIEQYLEKKFKVKLCKIQLPSFYSLFTGKYPTECALDSCRVKTTFDIGKRKFKEFCSKKCYNSSPENKSRREKTLQEKYGVDNPFKSKEVQQKIKESNIKRYGVENPSQSNEIKLKKQATCQKHFGTNHHMQSPTFMAKYQANLEKTLGVQNVMLLDYVQEKVKQTCLEKYGVDNIRKDPTVIKTIQEKYIKTCLEKYGTTNAMQSPDVLAKWRTAVAEKDSVTINGKVLTTQGYEASAILKISKSYTISRITTNPKKVGVIPYTYLGKNHVYLPDFKMRLKGKTKVYVEVKSWFTLASMKNIPKFKAAMKTDHEFWLAIVEPKIQAVRLIKNPDQAALEHLIGVARLFSSDHRQIL